MIGWLSRLAGWLARPGRGLCHFGCLAGVLRAVWLCRSKKYPLGLRHVFLSFLMIFAQNDAKNVKTSKNCQKSLKIAKKLEKRKKNIKKLIKCHQDAKCKEPCRTPAEQWCTKVARRLHEGARRCTKVARRCTKVARRFWAILGVLPCRSPGVVAMQCVFVALSYVFNRFLCFC